MRLACVAALDAGTVAGRPALAENCLVLLEHELDELAALDHRDGKVALLRLWPDERRSEDDRHVLHQHPVLAAVLDDAAHDDT